MNQTQKKYTITTAHGILMDKLGKALYERKCEFKKHYSPKTNSPETILELLKKGKLKVRKTLNSDHNNDRLQHYFDLPKINYKKAREDACKKAKLTLIYPNCGFDSYDATKSIRFPDLLSPEKQDYRTPSVSCLFVEDVHQVNEYKLKLREITDEIMLGSEERALEILNELRKL